MCAKYSVFYSMSFTLLIVSLGYAVADFESEETPATVKVPQRLGRYVPELHGAQLGKYVPDYRGKYHHIAVPYDGGYGDRGLKYIHDVQQFLQKQFGNFQLGPKDHLRFMIDFNFNGTGWQVIHFEWTRDGDETRQYNFVHENRLWEVENETSPSSDDYSEQYDQSNDNVADFNTENPYSDNMSDGYENENVNVHVDGDYGDNNYQITYRADQGQYEAPQDSNIQNVIGEVLDYIQTSILPSLA